MKQHITPDSMPAAGLPERYLCLDDRFVFTDDDGFLQAGESLGLVAISELFRHWCSLVLAPPWMGKTFVSERIGKALETGGGEAISGTKFDHVWRTCFELPRAHDQLPPPWWHSWRRSDKTACWVIDAIDEGHHRQAGTGDLLAGILEDLDERERGRLRVLMFSRQIGLPEDMPDRMTALEVHSTAPEPVDFVQYQFAALTREEAGRIVGGPESLERVVQIIRLHDLQDEARYPKVLEYLAKLPVDAVVTTEMIWHGLLMELLTEWNPKRQKPPGSELEDRFRAAARIAAVLTLTGEEEFLCEGYGLSGLCLNEIIPDRAEPSMPSRQAARESLDSALFQRTPTGYRFAQRNIQEKLCAFGLKGLRLSALTPMMVDSESRPSGMHVEVLNFLGAVSDHGEVRKWVAENTGLLKSDAPRLPLSSAKNAIDRLVDVVQKTPHYLYEVDLRRLSARGIGGELRRRLRNWARMKPTVLRLLLDTSAQTGAKEVVSLACKIALDSRTPIPVRRSAVRVVQRCGANEYAKELEPLAIRSGCTEGRRNLAAAVARGLLERGIWDVLRAARFAPEKTPRTVDSCSMLLGEIKKEATVEDARAVIREFLKTRTGTVIRPTVDPLSLTEPRKELLYAMTGTLLEQEQLSDPDVDVLAWAAVSVAYYDLPDRLGGKLVRKISEQAAIRRKVFEVGLQDCQENVEKDNHKPRHAAWQDLLQYEDICWLAQRAQAMDDCPEFAWRLLLVLVYHRSEGKVDALAQKRRIGKLVREHAPDVFDRFTASRSVSLQRQREFEQRQRRQQEKKQRFGIDSIVRDILGREGLGLQQKLWNLSWICFVEPSFRPDDVDGQWADLTDDVRDSTLHTCLSALGECDPTPVPEGQSYRALIGYEASAFIALLRYRSPAEWLTVALIKKWLPSVLRASVNEQTWACSKCLRVSFSATREVALDWVNRELRQENPSGYVGAELPAELWDETFAERISEIVRDAKTPTVPRTGLLELLAGRSSQHALLIAREWASQYGWDNGKERPIRQAGLNVLLRLSPEAGWPIAKQLYESHGPSVILGLDAICDPWTKERNLREWPNDALVELGVILHKEFPSTAKEHESDSAGGSRSDEARWARSSVLDTLRGRGAAAHDALQRLADAVPAVKEWLNYHQASQAADRILDITGEPTALPLADVLRVLSEAEYRLIRTSAHLLRVLVETLTEQITANTGEHLHLLYDRQHKHLREDALQAYVACRLKDLLPGKVLHRETQINRRQRTDILVESPTIGGPITAVVIEVKWSDNSTTKDSLTKQLGKEYLLNEGKKHGIYLVGWCGRTSWRALKDKTSPGLRRALERQAKTFCKCHQGTGIQAVVLDLRWSTRG